LYYRNLISLDAAFQIAEKILFFNGKKTRKQDRDICKFY